jgi:hypothetical protein
MIPELDDHGDLRDCWRSKMIQNDIELQATQERIARFQQQLAHLRKVETNPTAFRLSAGGYIAEIDRMQLDVREYLGSLPAELKKGE